MYYHVPYDCLVIGCGLAGITIAREMAERANRKVLIIERRGYPGGNAHDYVNADGILVHRFGPHIFHTNSKRVFDHLSRFTGWRSYNHEVLGDIHGHLMPIPFNLNSLYLAFDPEKAARIEKKLLDRYGSGCRIPVLHLREDNDAELKEVAEYIYENIYLHYTEKQWGLAPEELDPTVTARVPIYISYDNRYFQDAYQGMPKEGYASLFQNMLDHPGIDLCLNSDARKKIGILSGQIFFNDHPFYGTVIYTGALDEFFDYRFGRLPYRTLDFVFETHHTTWFQPAGQINYPVDRDYTRITEFKHLTGQEATDLTTIVKEFPGEYSAADGEIPCYPINNAVNDSLYEQYRTLIIDFPRFFLLGRLAEYKYYNMDSVVLKALELADALIQLP